MLVDFGKFIGANTSMPDHLKGFPNSRYFPRPFKTINVQAWAVGGCEEGHCGMQVNDDSTPTLYNIDCKALYDSKLEKIETGVTLDWVRKNFLIKVTRKALAGKKGSLQYLLFSDRWHALNDMIQNAVQTSVFGSSVSNGTYHSDANAVGVSETNIILVFLGIGVLIALGFIVLKNGENLLDAFLRRCKRKKQSDAPTEALFIANENL
eukprot:GHVT01000719.1.p1 GENE.GHVT01000719.1~~GHVT01000719.1.p1  ORF type:complete len:208 (-),score=12.49 GHVT01000719.1:154-777(-)